jgi:putative RecB family exonuclease
MKFSPYSYSKIDSFKHCPHKFKLSYIDKIKVFTTNEALEKGSRVHQIIELWVPNQKELPAFNYVLLSEEKQQEAENIALKFIQSEMGQSYLLHPGAIGHEIHMGLDTKLSPSNYHNPNTMLRGKIDFLIKDGRTLIVVDWKTGKVKSQEYQTNDQVMLYSIWAFNMFSDIDTVIADYVYVEHNEINTFRFERQYYKNYTRSYANHIKAIETETVFPKSVGRLCDWCDYKKQGICDAKETV